MKKTIIAVLTLMVAGFIFMANVQAVSAADDGDKYIAMYKTFFKDIEGKRYQKVWDVMTLSSKNAISKSISNNIRAENKESTQSDVLNKLENNSSNLRTNYFDNLNSEFEKISFQQDIRGAQFAIKSASQELVVITITVNNAPKDFKVIREAGRWKINFFEDLML